VEDARQFAKDVAQSVSVKPLQDLSSYKFESAFETWVETIVENEARSRARKLVGRSKHGRREFLSFEEWRHQPVDPVVHDREHREILRKALQRHRAGGAHNEKSADAIELRYFEDLDTPEVAERVGLVAV
jgi:RNA polymerase sigma factor (sigma-70 family)